MVPTLAGSIRLRTAWTTWPGVWPASTIRSLSSPMTSFSAIFSPSTSLARTARVTSIVCTWLSACDMAFALASRFELQSMVLRRHVIDFESGQAADATRVADHDRGLVRVDVDFDCRLVTDDQR